MRPCFSVVLVPPPLVNDLRRYSNENKYICTCRCSGLILIRLISIPYSKQQWDFLLSDFPINKLCFIMNQFLFVVNYFLQVIKYYLWLLPNSGERERKSCGFAGPQPLLIQNQWPGKHSFTCHCLPDSIGRFRVSRTFIYSDNMCTGFSSFFRHLNSELFIGI